MLASALEGQVKHVVVLLGGMGRRQLQAARDRLADIPDDESRVILATGSFLGEGFDDARLDTLFLALPISWKGRLTQFVGRLHRSHDGKKEVRVYDYVDLNVAVCAKMYDRRASGYEAIGYKVVMPIGVTEGWPASVEIPVVPHWKETFSDSLRRLCRDGVDEALANLFVFTTLQFDLGEQVIGRVGAQDAVRKFIFARLESLPETKGRFRIGERLPIPCGANPLIEVALISVQDRLVIMLDELESLGDSECYRRSRREDLLLQNRGYRVLRFLNEDVCAYLDVVLDNIQLLLSSVR